MLTVETNSHSKLWGNETNSRGKKWEDFIEKEQVWYITKAELPPLKVKMENPSLTLRLAIDFQMI